MRRQLLIFLLLRLPFLGTRFDPGDVRVYYGYTQEAAKGGLVFRDFRFEYPPLAYAFVVAPRVLAPHASFEEYRALFRLQCLLLDGLTFILLARSGAVTSGLLMAYSLSMAVLGPVLLHRLDIFVAFVFAVAILALRTGHSALAYTLLGVGGSYKVFPALCLLAVVSSRERITIARVLSAARWCALGVAFPFALAVTVAGPGVFGFIGYHASRGIQIESTWASIAVLCSGLGWTTIEVYWHAGCHNIRSGIEPLCVVLAPIILAVSVFAPLALGCKRAPPGQWTCAAATLSGILLTSKVLSPQFFVFLMPLLAVAGTELRRPRAIGAFMLLLALLTTASFPFLYDHIIGLHWYGWVAVVARNVVLSALVAFLYYSMVRTPGLPSA